MKQLFILISLLFSIVSYAQPTKSGEVCMPTEVARQVASDLVTGDSAKAMLSLTIDELNIVNGKLSYKDSLILNSKLKEINLTEQIKNEKLQKEGYAARVNSLQSQYDGLAKKYKRYKSKKIFTDVLFITALITGAYLHYR